MESNPLDTITLALDWSPNVLHAGIFLAEMNGWFEEEGIYLNWYTTEIDNYTKKPIMRVIDGEADVSIGPSEHLLFMGMNAEGEALIEAAATILQRDQSAFVVKTNKGISRPADLDGKVYLGYKTPLEDTILKHMIRHDGGEGNILIKTPARLDVWDAFMNDSGHVAWVFTHWEGALAQQKGVQLHAFYPSDYGVPYGYSSVLMVRSGETDSDRIQRFLGVLERAYIAVSKTSAKELAIALVNYVDHENFSDHEFVALAISDIQDAFLDEGGNWGGMEDSVWASWASWIK